MRKLLLFVLVAFAFAACEQAPIEEQTSIRQDAPETITVGFEGDNETRIQLNEAQKTVWTKGDLVSVFYRSNANQKWQYQGETGERTGTIKRVSNADATQELSDIIVVYPYNENYYINPRTYNVQAFLPATQTYLKDSYGVGGNIMISQGEYNQFSLKSVCGWLKIQLTGNGEKVQSITLRGNNGEQVAGEIYINSATAEATLASEMGSADDTENGAGGNLVFDDTILTEVTLDCGEGVALGAEATAFYIALPPQTFEQGFTAVVGCDGYEPLTLETTKPLVIERNTIQPMAALEVEFTLPGPANNEIWYTSSDGSIITPYKSNAFGANIASNTYENGQGVILFDAPVTSIGNSAFSGCRSLTSVTIPNSVTSIGSSAFFNCKSLTSITIPDSVTTIGTSVFMHCTSLKAFYGKFASADNRCLIIDGVLNSFAQAGLTKYTIPDSVTSIGEDAFFSCTSLTSVTIPDSVTSIGNSAFYSCDLLTSVTIGNSVTSIGDSAFSFCDLLTSVTIPDSVTSIGSSAFYGCTSLTSVTIPDSVTSIGTSAFYGCKSLTSVTIPNCVTDIGFAAFQRCTSLTSVTIGNSVTTIGTSVFMHCTSLKAFYGKFASADNRCLIIDGVLNSFAPAGLTEYTIPNSVTSIENWAFAYCESLTSVTIPNCVTDIGFAAFQRCTSLKSVYCKPTTPPSGATSMFDSNASNRNIYVPRNSASAYKSAEYWSDYASYIEGYDF